jgi:phage shock protein PspC (stress-responsive transcriptional regulator)
MIAGVSAGIARHLNIDPTLVRLAFIVMAVAGGFGFAAYLAAFLLIPEEGSDEPPFRRFGSHRAATIAGVTLLVVAALSTIDLFDGHGVAHGVIWACVLAGAGGFLLLRAQGDTAPVTADDPTLATAQVPARRRRTRSTQIVAGVLLLVAAAVAAAAAAGADIGWQEGAAIALMAAGGVLVAGAFLGASPWLALPPLLLAAAVASLVAAGAALDGPIGERDFTPVQAQELPEEYQVAIGELRVDLRSLALAEGTTHLRVEVGIGEAHVIVPRGVGLHVTGHAGAGDVRLPGGESNGTDVDREETIVAPGRPVLDLEVRAGLGDVRVEQGS